MAGTVPSAAPTASTTQTPAYGAPGEGAYSDAQAMATAAFFFLVAVSTAILLSNFYPRMASAWAKKPYADIPRWKRRAVGVPLLFAIGLFVSFCVSVVFEAVNSNSTESVSATSVFATGIAVIIAAAAYAIVIRVNPHDFSREALIRNGIGLGIAAICLIAANQWAHGADRAAAGREKHTTWIDVQSSPQPNVRIPIQFSAPAYLGKNDSGLVSIVLGTAVKETPRPSTKPGSVLPCHVRLDPQLTTLGLKTTPVPSAAPVEIDATAPPAARVWSWVVLPLQEGRHVVRFSMLYEVRGGRNKRCHAGDKGTAYEALQYVEVVAPLFSDSFARWLAIIATSVGIVSTVVGLFKGKEKPESGKEKPESEKDKPEPDPDKPEPNKDEPEPTAGKSGTEESDLSGPLR